MVTFTPRQKEKEKKNKETTISQFLTWRDLVEIWNEGY